MIKRPIAKETKVWATRPGPALRGRLLRGSALSVSLLALTLAGPVSDAYANPEGGSVVVGDATITPVDGSTIEVDQSSDRIVIDWESFSIDEGETVNFIQPGSTSIALNRVTGFDQSFINGVLTADGYIFLVNPNGIIFGASALVDVGGLVASTADITNDDFAAGNFNFDIASPVDGAMVANLGSITVADAGLAALVAPTVRNSGVITANLGTVQLAGAQSFTLDFYGDGLFSFDTGAIVDTEAADGGALVENTGTISATGGYIYVTALGAQDIINNAINMDGIIEASSVGYEGGTIVLSGGDAGLVSVAGTLDVSGESGGSISITGEDIAVAGDAALLADAGTNGDGGDIIMVADNTMTFEGALYARGGSESGNGGFAEISGEVVNVWAPAYLGAANGEGGTLYIDPTDETIDAGEATAHSTTLGTGANVTIEADNDIFVNNAIDGTGGTATGGDLTLTSGRSTEINATITLNDGNFTSNINTQPVVYGAMRDTGTASFTNTSSIVTNGGVVTIQSGTLTTNTSDVITGAIESGGGSININTDGDVDISTGTLDGGGGNIAVTSVADITVGDGAGTAIDASVGGDVVLTAVAGSIIDGGGLIDMSGGGTLTLDAGGDVGSGGAIDTSGTFSIDGTAGGSAWNVSNSGGTLTVGSVIAAGGSINIDAVGDVDISTGTLNASGGDIAVTSTADITVGDGAGTAIDASIGGDVFLDAGANIVDGGGVIDMSGGGTLTLDAAGAVGSNSAIDTSGAFTIQGTAGTGRWYVSNSGGALTVDDVTSTAANIDIFNNNTVLVTGSLQAATTVYVAGTGMTISGTVSGTTIDLDTDALNIQATLTATDIYIAPISGGVDISLNGTSSLDLTNAELALLNSTGTVFFGNTAGSTDEVFIGAGTDISGEAYDLTLAGSGTLTFDDTGTALTADVGQIVDITGSDITGGGTMTDVAFTGVGKGSLDFDASGAAVLDVSGDVALEGTATGAVTYVNDGDLTIEGLSGTTIDVDVTGDTTVNTGTIVAGGDLTLTSSGTITVGSGAGTAIDASGGVYDVSLDAGEDIVDGGGIIDMTGGGTLTMDAASSVGAAGAAIETSGTFFLAGSADDGDFHVDSFGGTLTVQDVTVAGTLTDGDLVITNSDGDISIVGTAQADGNATADAGTGTLSISGTLTANAGGGASTGDTATLIADNMALTGAVNGGNITIAPSFSGRDVALNDSTGSTLNLTNAELATLSTTGTVTIGGAGTGDVYMGGDGSVDVTGASWATATVSTTGTVFLTNGIETQDTDVNLSANVELTGNTLIDTVNGGTGADVHVTGTIDATTTGTETLTVAAGVGDITFDSAVGGSVETGNLGLSGNNIVVTDISTVGTQTYTATGEVTFGSSYLTNGSTFDLTGGLTLADDVLIDTSIGAGTGANITIDDITNNGYILTLDAGSDGDISLNTWTNTGGFTGMGTLNITDSNNTTISGTVSGDTLRVFDSTTEVFLLGDVDLQSLLFDAGPYAVTITGSSVFLVDQVVFNNSGIITLGDNAGDVFVFTGGVDATNGGVVISGDFSFSGTGLVASSLSLAGDTTLATDATMLIGDVFGNGYTLHLDGETTGDITLATFQNAAGTGQLHLINADEFLATSFVTAGTVDIDTAQTSVIFQGLVTATDLIVGAGNYLFALYGSSVITNFVTFLNSGGVDLGDDDGDTTLISGGLQSTASDTTIAGLVQSEAGAMTFGNVVLTDNATLDTTLNNVGGAAINVNGTIDSTVATAYDLDVIAGNASTATFTGNIGDTTPLGSLYVSALNIILHDVATVGEQIYEALNNLGNLGQVQLNSTYMTQGADFDLTGNVLIGDHATVDTTWGGAYTMGDIRFGGTGGQISFGLSNGTLELISGGSTTVRADLAGSLANSNTLTVWSRDHIEMEGGGTLGNDLILHAGAFDGDLEANPLQNITFHSAMTIGDLTDLTATGDITFLDVFNTYELRVQLNGHLQSFAFSPVNIEEAFSIGGLTTGLGTADLVGSIRGVDSDQAAAFARQLEIARRDDLLFNGCIIEVGCLNFDPSGIVIPVFDPVIYLYERDGTADDLRFSDLPNTEIWYGLGGAPDIWEERLGRNDDDEEEGESSSQNGGGQ